MLDRTKQPDIHPLESFQIAKPEYCTLSNGIPVKIFQSGEEEVLRLDILVRGGQWEQEQALQATFTAQMLREGTKTFTSVEIAEKLDFYGAWLECSSSMNYFFVTLYTLKKFFSETIRILTSILREPVFPEKEFLVLVKTSRQRFLVNQHKVEILARKQLNRALFGADHPCARYAVLTDYDCLNTELLKRMYRRCFHAKNCTFYLSGKVDDHVLRELDSALGQTEWGEVSEIYPMLDKQLQPMQKKHFFIEHPDAVQSAVSLGMLTIDCHHVDFVKLRLLIILLGGYFGSRLMKNIREDKGYTYGISANLISYPFHSMLTISTQTANEYAHLIAKETNYEISRLKNELISNEELRILKNYVMGDMCRGYESPFSLADAYIYLQTLNLDPAYFDSSQKTVMEITADELQTLACKYLREEELTEVIAGKKM